MGLFGLFGKKNTSPARVADHMQDEKLKDSLLQQSVALIKDGGDAVNENSSIEAEFKYLENVEHSGLRSMYIVTVDGRPYYFSIEKDNIRLLDESAKKFFEIDEDE